MTTHVVIPWRPGGEHRRRARRWVMERWVLTFPEYEIHEAAWHQEPWSKANAVMPVIDRLSPEDIVIVADADVWCCWVSIAAGEVQGGDFSWAVPHRQLRRLSEESTAAVLAGENWRIFDQPEQMAEPLRVGVPGGGMVIARARVFQTTPLDPRFVGWGQEDHAWGFALETLWGEPYRPKGLSPMAHLWHPPAERLTRTWGNRQGVQLHRRYLKARGDVDAMLKLIGEIDRPVAAPAGIGL